MDGNAETEGLVSILRQKIEEEIEMSQGSEGKIERERGREKERDLEREISNRRVYSDNDRRSKWIKYYKNQTYSKKKTQCDNPMR